MTKEQLHQRFEELLQRAELELTVWAMFGLVTESGTINMASEPDDYSLPKIILYAILCEMAAQYKPFDAGNRRDAEKLKLYI